MAKVFKNPSPTFTVGMFYLRCYLFFLLALPACLPETHEKQRNRAFQGTWYAEKRGLYHTLYVQDSLHIALDTHIDTTFFYEYKIEGDSLAIYKPHGELVNYNPILYLTPDSLAFEHLLDRGEIMRYKRIKSTK